MKGAPRSKTRTRSIHTIVERPVSALRPYEGNARTHSKRQIRQLMDSITRFGFINPVLVADDDTIVAGHGRVLAAERFGMGKARFWISSCSQSGMPRQR